VKKISPLFYLPAVLAMKAIIQRGTAMHTLPLNSASLNNSKAALKTTAAIIGGGVMTFAAFAFMQYLISAEQRADVKTGPDITVEIYEVPKDSKVQVKQTLPPPPTAKMPPKTPPRPAIDNPDTVVVADLTPTMTFDNIGDTLSKSINQPTGDATPIVRINPKYPPVAARDGIEGWVQISFSISPTGEVINPVIIDAEPKRVFDREAIRAIKRWKYRPKVVEGVAQLQANQSVQLDFKIDG